MKALKYIFLILLIAVLGAALYFSIQDGDYRSTFTRTIDAPPALVYQQLSDFSKWQQWQEDMAQDKVMDSVSSPSNDVGSSLRYGKDALDNKITIDSLSSDDFRIVLSMQDQTPLGLLEEKSVIQIQENSSGSQVEIKTEGKLGLMQKVKSSLYGYDAAAADESAAETILAQLDGHITKMMDEYSIEMTGVTEYGGGYYLYMSTASQAGSYFDQYEELRDALTAFAKANNIQTTGRPFSIFEKNNPSKGNVIFSTALPVRDRVITPDNGNILSGFQESTRAVKVILRGNRKQRGQAWERAMAYLESNGLSPRPGYPPFEVYTTGPEQEINPALHITEIYLPLAPADGN